MGKIKLSGRRSSQAPTLKQSNSDRATALKVALVWKLYRCSASPSPGKKKQGSFPGIFPKTSLPDPCFLGSACPWRPSPRQQRLLGAGLRFRILSEHIQSRNTAGERAARRPSSEPAQEGNSPRRGAANAAAGDRPAGQLGQRKEKPEVVSHSAEGPLPRTPFPPGGCQRWQHAYSPSSGHRAWVSADQQRPGCYQRASVALGESSGVLVTTGMKVSVVSGGFTKCLNTTMLRNARDYVNLA